MREEAAVTRSALLERLEALAARSIGGFGARKKRKRKAEVAAAGQVGRLRWENGFADVWLGGVHYDLRKRHQVRLCIEYLVKMKAFDEDSARHFDREIDPYVRKHGNFNSAVDVKIGHYFNDRGGPCSELRRDLIRAVGRNGKFYLSVG